MALHFLLNLDGYDCELILGKNKEGKIGLYFIDFDKVSCFDFRIGDDVHLIRKTSESDYEVKDITSYNKLARFLYSSFTSMSLLPSNPILKSYFLMGYKKYAMGAPPTLMYEIVQLVDEYFPDIPGVCPA